MKQIPASRVGIKSKYPTKSKPVTGKGKWSEASDDKSDKKHKIVEGSKADMKLDKKRGVPEKNAFTNIRTQPTRQMFGLPAVKSQRDAAKGHAKALVMGHNKGVAPIIPASRTAKAQSIIVKGISKKFKPV